ncbi:hypothetical protein, variant [Aphanomyces astaci]|uniref:Uncharacterized protein n=1 Tax=Aphanomyces astaci TaxID=112090 RepID=W4H8Z7_APHAT|nr:hypothetical protein, variant [Aphanomyces astaci]ETV88520.1 hypothetical protein, variant [Aphanomyces astaci]|eukprot:XP_009820920.1 hypothetical protein, variant [Aphanomyces astaci]
MEHVDRIGHILRRAEKAHGRTDLTLLQVLEAAEHSQQPHLSRRVQQLVLTLSMDPEPNWWKKLARHVSRVQSMQGTMSSPTATDRFLDVMASPHHRRDELKQSRTQVAVPVDHPNHHHVHVFRVLASAFEGWAKVAKNLRATRHRQLQASSPPHHQQPRRGLPPVQFKALVRWLQLVWPASDDETQMNLSHSFHGRNRAIQLASDRLLRRWTLTKVWRGWMHDVARCTLRNVDVQRRWHRATLRRRRSCFLAWRLWAIHFGPKRRQLQTAHAHVVTRRTWQRWLQALEHAYTCRKQQHVALCRVLRSWGQFVGQRHRQRLGLERTTTNRSRRVLLEAWRQWQHTSSTQRQGRELAVRCDAVAMHHATARGVAQWRRWFATRQHHHIVTATVLQHVHRTMTRTTWRVWSAYVAVRRRVQMLQTTLPRLFTAALHGHYLHTWRYCAKQSAQEAKTVTAAVQFRRRARFWREWKQRKLIAAVVHTFRTQMKHHVRRMAFCVWLQYVDENRCTHRMLESQWAHRNSRQVARAFAGWYQHWRRRTGLHTAVRVLAGRRLTTLLRSWRELTRHRRHIRLHVFVHGLALHSLLGTRRWWTVWNSEYNKLKTVESHCQQRLLRRVDGIFTVWRQYARKHRSWRAAVSTMRRSTLTSTTRRLLRLWSGVTKAGRAVRRVLAQHTDGRNRRRTHRVWRQWVARVIARTSMRCKLLAAMTWQHERCLGTTFAGWRRVLHTQKHLRAKSRLVCQTLSLNHVGRMFQQWRGLVHNAQGKKELDDRCISRRLCQAVQCWHRRAGLLRRVRHTLPRALGCSQRHTFLRSWRRWCTYTHMAQRTRQQCDLAEVAWTRRTVRNAWQAWTRYSRATVAIRLKSHQCQAARARRQLHVAVTTLHTTATFQRQLRQWTTLRSCHFFTSVAARVLERWQQHTRTQSGRRRARTAQVAHMQRRWQHAAVQHWHNATKSKRLWTAKLGQAKRWFHASTVHVAWTTWKVQIALVRRQKHSMRGIVQRWHQLDLAGRMLRWRAYADHRLHRSHQTAAAATAFQRALCRRALTQWQQRRIAQLALKRRLQDLLGTRRLAQLQHCTATWRSFVHSKQMLVAKLHEFMATSSATLMSTRFALWSRHAWLAPQLRAFRYHRHIRICHLVLREWRQRVDLRHRFSAVVALLEGRSMSSLFSTWRASVFLASQRRVMALEIAHATTTRRHLQLVWRRWRQWQHSRPLLRRVAALWPRSQQYQAIHTWQHALHPLVALESQLTLASAHRRGLWIWKQWRILHLRRCRQATTQAAVDAFVDLLDQSDNATTVVCTAAIHRWQCVAALRGFERWREMASAQRLDRTNSIRALQHWLVRQLSRRFDLWREMVHLQRRHRAAIAHCHTHRKALVLAQWAQFTQDIHVQRELKHVATHHWTAASRHRALTAWVQFKHEAGRLQQTARTIRAGAVRRCRRLRWTVWTAYVAHRRSRRHLAHLLRAFRCQVVLKAALRSWRYITRTLVDTRTALQATVLRLEVLVQLPCLRAWREWTLKRQRRRHMIQTLERGRRWSMLHVQFYRWLTAIRYRQSRRHRIHRHHMHRGVAALVYRRQTRMDLRVLVTKARTYAEMKQERRRWTLFCMWHLWARRQRELRLATAFAAHCHIQRWRRWAVRTHSLRSTTHHIMQRWATHTIRCVFDTLSRHVMQSKLAAMATTKSHRNLVHKAFVGWAGYRHTRQTRQVRCTSLLRNYWTNALATRWRRWRDLVRKRRRVRATNLPRAVPTECWREWRVRFKVATAGRVALCRRKWVTWQLAVRARQRKLNCTDVAEQRSKQRAVQRWRCFQREKTTLALRHNRALVLLTGRTAARFLILWKQFAARQHLCRQQLTALSDRSARRQYLAVAMAWIAHFRIDQRRKQRIALGVARTQQRRQQRAVVAWVQFVSHQHHHALQDDLAWQFRAQAVVLRCFQRWIRLVLDQQVRRAKCARVGHVIMGHVVQRLFMTWQHYSQAKQLTAKRHDLAVRVFEANSCRWVWTAWTKRMAAARWRARATKMATQHITTAHWRQWKHHHVTVQVLKRLGAITRSLLAQCLAGWSTVTATARSHRAILSTIQCQRGGRSRASVFNAWKQQAWLRATKLHLTSRWYAKLAVQVWAAWRQYMQRGAAAAALTDRRTRFLETVRRDRWRWWRHLFVATRHCRLHKLEVVLRGWRVAGAARRRAVQIVATTRSARTQGQARSVLMTWHVHVTAVKATQRYLIWSHRRDQWINRMDRVRCKRMVHTHWYVWVHYAAIRTVQTRQWRAAQTARISRRMWNGWLTFKVSQQVLRRAQQRRTAIGLSDAVSQWFIWTQLHFVARTQWLQAAANARHRNLRRRWHVWRTKVAISIQVGAVATTRHMRQRRQLWHEWQVQVHVARQTRQAVAYARVREIGRRLHQWLAFVRFGRCFRRLHCRAGTRRLRRFVRLWVAYGDARAASRRHFEEGQRNLNTWKKRAAVSAWKRRWLRTVHLQSAKRFRQSQLWQQWRSRVLMNYADRFFAKSTVQRCWTSWRQLADGTKRCRAFRRGWRRRHLHDVLRAWLGMAKTRHIQAQAAEYATLKAKTRVLVAWQRAVAVQKMHAEAMAETAARRGREWNLRTRWRQWNEVRHRAKQRWTRLRKQLKRWSSDKQVKELRRLWHAWTDVTTRRQKLREFLDRRQGSDMTRAWTAWGQWRHRQQFQRLDKRRADGHFGECIQRKVLFHWHVYAAACNHRRPG